MVIYKAVLGRQLENNFLDLPQGAEVVHVHEQNGHVCLWCLCNPDLPNVVRTFQVVGTGWLATGRYVGTAHVGELVWHVMELP